MVGWRRRVSGLDCVTGRSLSAGGGGARNWGGKIEFQVWAKKARICAGLISVHFLLLAALGLQANGLGYRAGNYIRVKLIRERNCNVDDERAGCCPTRGQIKQYQQQWRAELA